MLLIAVVDFVVAASVVGVNGVIALLGDRVGVSIGISLVLGFMLADCCCC